MKKFFPKRLLVMWQIRAFLIFIILQSITIIFSNFHPIMKIIIFINIITYIFSFFYLILNFSSRYIFIDEEKIIFRKGVIIKKTTIIPKFNIMTTNIKLPLNRIFKLNLIIFSSGRFSLIIDGIENNVLEHINLQLVE